MVNKYMAKSKEEILDIIDKELEDNTIIYIKSSNGMKLYELGDYIVEKHG
jgi:UDP-N-acetylmuramyl pentapeptide synthase